MWWLEPHSKALRLARLAMIFVLAGLVAGCFQPLYASRTASGNSTVAEQLRLVDIAPIKVELGSPTASMAAELRNALIFDLAGGAPTGAPTHRLAIQVALLRQQVIVDITTSRPDLEQAGITATYTLIEIASGKVVVTGQAFSRVSYDNPGQAQRFSRARGERDADTRAAKVISENIRSRLASYFIAGT
jgi:LPS-assembly lipoprotein